ncbi:mitochondrial chaperone [Trichophyton mentagrophytes]|nr:mitochondrial chaperone [Trichophyton mentagrophytes]
MHNFDGGDISSKKRFEVRYTPAETCTLYYQGKRIWYSQQREVRGNVMLESISLEEIPGSNGINNLLQEICQSENKKLSVYRPTRPEVRQHSDKPWRHISSRKARPIESVVLDKDVKDMVLDDIKKFLNSEEWYSEVGIPYRRGILLEGPPGTGKTSLSCALAGHFGLNMYCVMLGDPGLTNDDLFDLLNCLPKRCIVVLEDIDCAQLGRRDIEGLGSYSSEKKISLLGLLNAIDGPVSSEGRVTIMTTNYAE